MTQHTKFKNDKDVLTSDVIIWLQTQFDKKIMIGVSLNHDGTIKTLEIGKKLTIADIKKITDKFPELKGKEIE